MSHTDAPDEERSLALLVADVIYRIAPAIPGLPTGAPLCDQVRRAIDVVREAARSDPYLARLSPAERHSVLAGRVGILLSFGEPGVT